MDIKFLNKALLIEENSRKILAMADLHIGYEESLGNFGARIPLGQYERMMEDLKKLFAGIGKLNEIVICGDLKHEFGTISEQEWKETGKVLDFLGEHGKIVLVKGNHDTILGPIAKRKGIEIRDFYIFDGICFIHGDKIFSESLDKKTKMIVMGHRHPAVVISDKYKKERYKCFLEGKWKGKRVVILPSYFPFVDGHDVVNDEENNRMFISSKELEKFKVHVVSDSGSVYEFGKLGSIER